MGTYKMAYLVPEFPTQTHGFFWQEINLLQSRDLDLLVISTIRPDRSLCHQEWAKEAHTMTLYAFPPWNFIKDFLNSATKIQTTGIISALKFIAKGQDMGPREKVKLFGIFAVAFLFGAKLVRSGVRHIHSHFQYSGADLVFFIHKIYGISYSITRHGDNCGIGNQSAKWSNAAFGITVTDRLRKDLLLEQSGLQTPLLVAPMGVDCEFFKRSAPYKPYKTGDGPLMLFCCSRINPAKGYKELLHCLSQLVDDDLDVRLIIGGQDEQGGLGYMTEVISLTAELNLKDRVRFLGSVTRDKVRTELERAHIFILPTKQEAIGVAYMEAMAMELPVIASRVGGVPELISDRITGMLVDPGDVDGLVRAVERLSSDGLTAKRMGVTARKTVLENFKPERSVEALLEGLNSYTNFFKDS